MLASAASDSTQVLPSSSATFRAVPPSMFCVTDANTPIFSMSTLTTSAPDLSSFSARAPTAIVSSGMTTGGSTVLTLASRFLFRFRFSEPRAPRNCCGRPRPPPGAP